MLRQLTIVLASSFALACAAPAPEPTPNSDKSDEAAACAADESLLSCITEQCPDLTGDAFDDCFTDNCEEGHDDTPLTCGLCIVNGFEAGEDAAGIVSVCTGTSEPAPSPAACESDESILSCITSECPDLVGQEFDDCFTDNCEESNDDTPLTCALCVVDAFEAGLDAEAIANTCTSSDGAAAGTLTGVACASADLELFTCLSDNCPDADTGDAIGDCAAEFCEAEANQTSVSCLLCVDVQLSEPSAAGSDLESTCTAIGSAPCDVDRAADIQDCAVNQCPGDEGDALDECMDQQCPEVFDDVSEQCGQCIISLNQNGVPFGDAAANCGGH
jgi:hypothetical protein